MKMNRTIIIVSFMALAGFLAYLGCDNSVVILGAVAGPVTAYIGIKGQGSTDGK